MSIRNIPLWERSGKATPFLRAQWARRGATTALGEAFVLVAGGNPTPLFRGVWASAFPSLPPLPDDIATADGRGTAGFWLVFGD